jgi:hypothetical protein
MMMKRNFAGMMVEDEIFWFFGTKLLLIYWLISVKKDTNTVGKLREDEKLEDGTVDVAVWTGEAVMRGMHFVSKDKLKDDSPDENRNESNTKPMHDVRRLSTNRNNNAHSAPHIFSSLIQTHTHIYISAHIHIYTHTHTHTETQSLTHTCFLPVFEQQWLQHHQQIDQEVRTSVSSGPSDAACVESRAAYATSPLVPFTICPFFSVLCSPNSILFFLFDTAPAILGQRCRERSERGCSIGRGSAVWSKDRGYQGGSRKRGGSRVHRDERRSAWDECK